MPGLGSSHRSSARRRHSARSPSIARPVTVGGLPVRHWTRRRGRRPGYSRPPPPTGDLPCPTQAPLIRPGAAALQRPPRTSSARRSSPTSSRRSPSAGGSIERNDDWGTAAAGLPDQPPGRGRVPPAPVHRADVAARVAVAQPPDRRRRPALPDHQGRSRGRRRRPTRRRRWSRPRLRGRLRRRSSARDRSAVATAVSRVAAGRLRAAQHSPLQQDCTPRRTTRHRQRNVSAHFPRSTRVAVCGAPRLGHRLSNVLWKGASSMNINRVVLTGNLTRDPELRSTHSGTVDLQAAASPSTRAARTTPPATGRTSPTTSTSRCSARQAESCGQYLRKGRPVAIDGRLEWSEWESGGTEAPVRRYHR